MSAIVMKLAANNITVRQGDFELRNISFSLSDKENLAIIGASGSGKTTLAHALCGLLPFTGDLKIAYTADTNLLPQTTYVEQRYTIKKRTSNTEIYYQLRYNAVGDEVSSVFEELKSVSADEQRTDFLLNELSIAHLKNKSLLQLSSGEHKRFQLVKALLKPVQLLVLDEPFVGLDSTSRKKLNELLNGISENGTKLVVITGARHQLPACVTRTLNLGEGKQKQIFNSALLPLFRNELNFENAILMKNVTVKYGDKTILNNINWQVKKGERWLLKGKNGAGKSMLMSLVVADNPQAYCNEIYLFDRLRGSGESIWDIKKNIGFVSPELYAFFDKDISCLDAVASGYLDSVGVYGDLSDRQIRHARDWLKAFDISDLAKKRLSDISSGMQRIILLIRAFVKNPPLLILDEPCQGLDEYHTNTFVKLVDNICGQTDTTLVYISHYEDEIPNCVSQTLDLDESFTNHSIPASAVCQD